MRTAHRPSPRVLRALLIGILGLCFGARSGASLAQAIDPWRLRAAFLYNFSQFIEWPAEAFADQTAPFNICVLGPNRFGTALEALEKRNVRGHPIAILNPQRPADARNCHILYAADAHASGGKPWPALLGNAPVLTVIDSESARNVSAGIGFVEQGGKLRWVINLGVLRQQNLKVSAKLIEIAASVIGE